MRIILCRLALFILGFYAGAIYAGEFAYITQAASSGSIEICAIDPVSHEFKHCDTLYIDALSTPLDITFAKPDLTYAYIANNNYPNVMTQCIVGEEGELSFCVPTDVSSYVGITIHESDQLYAYLSHRTSVQKCTLGQDGALKHNACHDSGAGEIFLNGPMYVMFQEFNGVTYAYIANGDYHIGASVIQCLVEANGDFSNCKDSGAGAYFNGAADIDFAWLNEQVYAYVTQPGGGVAKCDVQPETGLFNSCTNTGGDFSTPIGMSVQKKDDAHYVYIVDGGFRTPVANVVKQCAILDSGDLACGDSGVGSIFANAFGIAVLNPTNSP